jgi:hypothetical protein
MNDNDQLEFTLGENEQAVTVEMSEDGSDAQVQEQETLDVVQGSSQEGGEELEQYSEKVKKRIDKLTARLRETQRREQAALEYARGVHQQSEEMRKAAMHSDLERFGEAKSRIETQSLRSNKSLKRLVKRGTLTPKPKPKSA